MKILITFILSLLVCVSVQAQYGSGQGSYGTIGAGSGGGGAPTVNPSGRVLYVSPSGNNSTATVNSQSATFNLYPTNTGPSALATNGDVVFLQAGTYLCTNLLQFNSGVTIAGVGPSVTILLQTNFNGGGNEHSLMQVSDNDTLQNFSWLVATNGGNQFCSFMCSEPRTFTNVVLNGLSLGATNGALDVFLANGGTDSSTQGLYQFTIKNCTVPAPPWDIFNLNGSSGTYQINGQHNLWIAGNTVGLARFLLLPPPSLFYDEGSRFLNFGGTNTSNISGQWFQGQYELLGSTFINSTNQFPLSSSTAHPYGPRSGFYYDAVAGVPYTLNGDYSKYAVDLITTNGCFTNTMKSFSVYGGSVPAVDGFYSNIVAATTYTSYGMWSNFTTLASFVMNDPADPNGDGTPNFYFYTNNVPAKFVYEGVSVVVAGPANYSLDDPNMVQTPPFMVSSPTNYNNISNDVTYKLSILNNKVYGNTNAVEVTTNLIVDGGIYTSSTNTLLVTASGLTNNTLVDYLVSVTAGTSLAVKDTNGNQFLAPVLNNTFPLKPGWRFTGTAVTGIATQQ